MFNISISETDRSIENFHDVLSRIYREDEIEKGFAQEFPEEKLDQFLLSVKSTVEKQSSKLFEFLSKSRPEDVILKKIYLGTMILPTSTFESSSLDEFLTKFIQNNLVTVLLSIIEKHLKIQKVKFSSRQKQETLLQIIEDLKLTIDTIIGNKTVFWGEDDPERFNKFSENMRQIQYPNGHNGLYFLDHELLYISFSNINVTVEDLTDEEISRNCKEDKKGRNLYNINGDIYIPFDKAELVTHIHRTQKKISIYADAEYAILRLPKKLCKPPLSDRIKQRRFF